MRPQVLSVVLLGILKLVLHLDSLSMISAFIFCISSAMSCFRCALRSSLLSSSEFSNSFFCLVKINSFNSSKYTTFCSLSHFLSSFADPLLHRSTRRAV